MTDIRWQGSRGVVTIVTMVFAVSMGGCAGGSATPAAPPAAGSTGAAASTAGSAPTAPVPTSQGEITDARSITATECRLIDLPTAAALLGGPATSQPFPVNPPDKQSAVVDRCHYQVTTGRLFTYRLMFITALPQVAGFGDVFKRDIERLAKPPQPVQVTLGDASTGYGFVQGNETFVNIGVLKGHHTIFVFAVDEDLAKATDVAKRVAEKVLAGL